MLSVGGSKPCGTNTHDKTLYRNYVRKWKFLIQEYELVKQKRHPKFRFVSDFDRPDQTTGRPSSSITTGSARAEFRARTGASATRPEVESRRVYGYNEQQVLPASGGWASTGMRFARSWLRSSST